MSSMKKFFGQRWVFNIGNTEVKIDNSFNTDAWGKERLIVNNEIVQFASGKDRKKQKFKEPWLVKSGDSDLIIALKAKAFSISCDAFLDGKSLECDQYLESQWEGDNHSWPEDEQWIEKLRISVNADIVDRIKKLGKRIIFRS